MKSLVESIKEGLRTRVNAKDLDPEQFEKWAEAVSKEGIGASVAKLKKEMVETIVAYGLKVGRPYDVDVMPVSWKPETDPSFGDKIEEILHKYFHFVKANKSGYIYLGPKKKTSVSSIKRWLGDDFSGTMENPNW